MESLSHDKIIEELNEVLQIDLDAVGAYQVAMVAIRETPIVSRLAEFKADHERHVLEVEALIKRYGGAPKQGPDLMGFVQKGMTRLAGVIGTEACLMAMQLNEKQTNAVYGRHVQKAFPEDCLAVLRRGFDDEKRHAAWIQKALTERLWEQDAHIGV